MNIEIDHVRAWLLDQRDYEAAALVSDAEFDFVYVDVAFRLDADEDFVVYELIIKVPPRIYRKLENDYKESAKRVEDACTEVQQSLRGGFARSVEWGVKIPTLSEVEGRADTEELFADATLAEAQRLWTKAKARLANDPEGAVTAARTMLESCCKNMIDSLGEARSGNETFPALYKILSNRLKLDSASPADKACIQIGRSCNTLIGALSEIRNQASDAHAPQDTIGFAHATFLVNIAGSLANFLVSLAQAEKTTAETPPTSKEAASQDQ